MPQFVPVANVAHVEVRGLLWGQKVQNALYFSKIDPPITPSDLDELASDITVAWYDSFRPVLARAYTFLEVVTTDLTTSTSPTGGAPGVIPWAGAYAGDNTTMPGSVTISIAFRSNGRGRSQRGRNYWPGVPRNTVSGNQVDQGYTNQVTMAYRTLLPAGQNPPAGWQWVIVSRISNKVPRLEGAIIPVTTVIPADYDVDSQRRRLYGRGQ